MFGSSGFGGFGQQNQQPNQQNQPAQQPGGLFGQQPQQNPAPGGFGSTPGFGSTGFGAAQPAQTGGGLFGQSAQQQQQQQPQQSQPFSFGSTNAASATPAFGARPAGTTGFGGFGSSTTTGAANPGSFSFGASTSQPQQPQQNTGFGSTTSTFGGAATGGGLFGQQQQQQQPAATGFGNAFGQPNAAVAAAGPGQITQGTAQVPYDPVREDLTPSEHIKDRKNWDVQQSIVVMPAYSHYSPEELRLMDYQQGRSKGTAGPGVGAPGTGFGFGGASGATTTFGQQPTSTGFGASQPATGGGLFGQQQQQQPQQTGGLFGQQNQQGQTGGLFGAKPATAGFGTTGSTGGLFGQAQQQPQQGGGLFGSAAQTGQQPSSGFAFGGANNQTAGQTGTGFSFGANNNQQQQNKPAFGFGATTQPAQPSTGFSFGGANTQQQQQPGQTGTGFGAGATGGFGFGAKPATGGLFGGATSQPGAQPGAPTSTFGGFGATSNAGAQQNKPSFSFGTGASTFGASSGVGAGSTAAPAAGGGLFGNAAPTTTSQPGGLFGGGASTGATGTGGFSFGGAQQQNQQAGQAGTAGGFGTGGLFGAKPAGQTGAQPATGGLFGNNAGQAQAGTGFGGTTAGGGLFGGASNTNNAAKPGGFSFGGGSSLFGGQQQQQQQPQQQPQQQQAGGLGTGFGQSANTAGSGLFGGAGQTQTGGTGSGGLFGGSSLFGNSTAGGGGLFGQSTTQPAQAGGLFGQSLGGNQPQLQQQQQPQQPTIQASLDSNPYGTDSLFASSLPPQAQGAAAQAPLPFNVAPKNKPPLVAPFRASPRSATKITRLRGSTPVGTGFGGREGTPGSIREGTPGAHVRFAGHAGSPSIFKGLSDEHSQPLSSQAFVSRPSSKRLVLDEPGESSFSASRSGLGRSGSVPQFDTGSSPLTSAAGFLRGGTAQPASRVSFSPALEQRAESVRPGGANGANTGDVSFASSLPSRRGNLFASTSLIDETPSKPASGAAAAKAAVTRPGRDLESSFGSASVNRASSEPTAATAKKGEYYLEPSLSALRTARYEELAAVHGFIVGRQGVGKVEFLEPVDLTTLPDLTDIAGGIVQIRLKEIVVYPEEGDYDPRNPRDGAKRNYDNVIKAEQGTGLNVPARVSLEGCWPIDRATREPIKDANHARVKQHINKLKNKGETEFVDYEAATGTWTFKVKHFSRYGLDDSDDDDDDASTSRPGPAAGAASNTALASSHVRAKAAALASSQRDYRAAKGRLGRSNQDDEEEDAPPPSKALLDADTEREGIDEDASQCSDDVSSAVHESDGSDNGDDEGTGGWKVRSSTPRATRAGFGRADRAGSATPSVPFAAGTVGLGGSSSRAGTPVRGFALAAGRNSSGLEARRVQVMQASFFGQDDGQVASAAVIPAVTSASSTSNKMTAIQTVNPRKHNRHSIGATAADGTDATLSPAPGAAPQPGPTAKASASSGADTGARATFGAEPLTQQPEMALPARKLTRLDLARSAVKGTEGFVLDAGLALGRSFRVGWGPDGSLVHNGKIVGLDAASANGSVGDDSVASTVSTVKIEKLNIFKDADTTTQEADKARRLLKVQLDRSVIEEDEEGCPVAYTQFETRFRHFAQAFELKDRSFEACLWRLGVALFDEIDLKLADGTSVAAADRIGSLRRKAALSNWLRHTVAGTVETESRAHVAASRKAALIFSYLSGNQIERATQAAFESGDLRLATLIAQTGGDEETKADINEQLLVWRQEGVDAHITKDHRRVYELLAGNVTVSKGTEARTTRDPIDQVSDLQIPEGLDWKRAFGLHLWYESSYESPLDQSFERYELMVGGSGGTAQPLPHYRESSQLGALRLKQLVQGNDYDKDAQFELIKLYAQPTHDLESTLNPRAFGPSQSDFRLPWHLYDLLSRVLRQRDFQDRTELGVDLTADGMVDQDEDRTEGNSARADGLASSYAQQLELEGLWTWSAFVLLHLELSSSRKAAIKALLARKVDEIDEAAEHFLCSRLQIPIEWIYEARAYEARQRDDRYDEYQLQLKARNYVAAHNVAVQSLAPEAVIRGDQELILSLFSPFYADDMDPTVDLPGWAEGGELFVDYLSASRELPGLLARAASGELTNVEAEQLERYSKRMTEMLSSVDLLFPRPEAELVQKVARTEMVAGLMNLLRSISNHSTAAPIGGSSHQKGVEVAIAHVDVNVGSRWDPAYLEVEAVQNSAEDYLQLLLGVSPA